MKKTPACSHIVNRRVKICGHFSLGKRAADCLQPFFCFGTDEVIRRIDPAEKSFLIGQSVKAKPPNIREKPVSMKEMPISTPIETARSMGWKNE